MAMNCVPQTSCRGIPDCDRAIVQDRGCLLPISREGNSSYLVSFVPECTQRGSYVRVRKTLS